MAEAAGYSEDEQKNMREVFDLFDKDKSGKISVAELGQLTATLGLKLTEKQLTNMLQQSDKDKDGQLSFTEFLQIMRHQPKSAQSDAYLLAAFKEYDMNGDGFITRKELRETMLKTGEVLSEEDLDTMINAADTDKDGRVNIKEFLSLMKS